MLNVSAVVQECMVFVCVLSTHGYCGAMYQVCNTQSEW